MSRLKTAYKGYTGLHKAIVTRIDDPEDKGRIQVCVVTYQGNVDSSRQGKSNSKGEYFWAQMCTTIFKSSSADDIDNTSTKDDSAFNNYLTNESILPIVYPEVGDIVWVMFEDTDIRTPVYMGSLATPLNSKNQNEGLTYSYQGGTLPEMTLRAITENVSYSAIEIDTDNTTKIGILGWKGNSIKSLLSEIKTKNESNFRTIMAGQTNFIRLIESTKIMSDISLEGTLLAQIIMLLKTEESKEVQNEKLIRDIIINLKLGQNNGLSKPDVLIYFVDLCLQNTKYAVTLAKKCKNDLETLHNLALAHPYMGIYVNRRATMYGTIVVMRENNEFSSATLPDDNMSVDEPEYVWILPSCESITRSFYPYDDAYFPGIEIASDNIFGDTVIAAHDGIATHLYDYETTLGKGRYVKIVNDSDPNNIIETQYCHLSSAYFELGVPTPVTAGTQIGTVGQSGEVIMPTLLFMFLINGVPKDPVLYVKSSNSVYNQYENIM